MPFTLHSDQRVTCAGCVPPDGRLVRQIPLLQSEAGPKLKSGKNTPQTVGMGRRWQRSLLRWNGHQSLYCWESFLINVVLETGPVLDSSFMVVTKPRQGKKKNTQRERAKERAAKKRRSENKAHADAGRNYNKSSNNSVCCRSRHLHTSQHAESSP